VGVGSNVSIVTERVIGCPTPLLTCKVIV
jgi:hypothetical protein